MATFAAQVAQTLKARRSFFWTEMVMPENEPAAAQTVNAAESSVRSAQISVENLGGHKLPTA